MAEYNLGTARGNIILDAKGAVAGAAAAENALDGIDRKSSSTEATMKKVGKGMLVIGAAAGAGLAVAVNAAGDFEAAISNFESATRVTAEELDQIREKALQIGRDTSFGAGEAANAMVELGKAGQSTEEILGGTADATIALAEAGEVDLTRSAEIMVATLSQFRLGAEDAARVSNALVGAADASTASVESLAEGMKYAGPGAAALGLSVEQTAASLALFEQNGINGSMAGTTLRSVLGNLNPATAKAKDAMRELGLYTDDAGSAFFDANGEFVGMAEAGGLLQETLGKLNPEMRNAAIEAIFGERAVSGVNAIVAEGKEGWEAYYEGVAGADAAETARIKLDNLKGSITILKGTIETFLIGVGLPLQDMLKGLVDGLIAVINTIAGLPPGFQAALGIGLAVVAMVGTLGGAFLLAVPKIMAMWKTFTLLRTAIMGVMVGPIGIAIAAVVALVAAFIYAYNNIEGFRNAVNNVVSAISGALGPAITAVAGWLRGALAGAMEWLRSTFESLSPQIAYIGTLFGQIATMIAPVVEWIGARLPGAFQLLWSIVEPVIGFIVNIIGNTLRMAILGVVNIFQGALQIIKGILQVFTGIFTGDWSKFWQGIVNIAKGIFNVIIGAVRVWLAVGVMKVVGAGFKLITGLFTKSWAAIRALFTSAMNAIRGNVTGGMNTIRGVFTSVMNAIRGVISGVWNVIRSLFTGGMSAARSAVSSGMSAVRSAFSSAMNTVRSLVRTAWSNVRTAFSTGVSNAVTTARSMISRIRGALGNLGSTLVSAGRNLVNGFIRGITGAISGAVDAARNMARRAKDAVTGFLRIGSPSKVFVDIGEDTVAGLVEGLRRQERTVRVAMVATVSTAVTEAEARAARTNFYLPNDWGSGTTTSSSRVSNNTINFAPQINVSGAEGMDENMLSDLIVQKMDERANALMSRFRSY